MARTDRILELLTANGHGFTRADLAHGRPPGMTAGELSSRLAMARPNVVAALSRLHEARSVVKVAGRPTYYLAAVTLEHIVGGTVQGRTFSLLELTRLAGEAALRTGAEPGAARKAAAKRPPASDPFNRLVGVDRSLRTAVEKARAAVLYPPSGLHTLIIGPTGVGKSAFAELMHRFAIESGHLAPGAPYVTFNCADYSHNPQLLLAHLFGAVRGSYTDATRDRPGLLEQADGGILFLDEVHRLPPEGQEMLFLLLDKGAYRRLGDTAFRRAKVLLLAATTEQPASALLNTFARRIPMTIELPSLADREPRERLDLLRAFLLEEAARTGFDIAVTRDAIRLLMTYDCAGNIGQLRSDLQLACARAFVHAASYGASTLRLDLGVLPDSVRHDLLPARRVAPDTELLLAGVEADVLFRRDQGEEGLRAADDYSLPESLYSELEIEVADLSRAGHSHEEIDRILAANLHTHFRRILDRLNRLRQTRRSETLKLLDPGVLQTAERAVVLAESYLERPLGQPLAFGLALHLQTTVERVNQGRPRPRHAVPSSALEGRKELTAAQMVAELVYQEHHLKLPPDEVALIAALFCAGAADQPACGQISVLVMSHGAGVATGMAQVANQVLGVSLVYGVDMPLDEPPAQAADRALRLVEEAALEDLVLLVDMGSLVGLGNLLAARAGRQTRTVYPVSTPMVLAAATKALQAGSTVDDVANAAREAPFNFGNLLTHQALRGQPATSPAIVTFCTTGQGSALMLKRIVEDGLRPLVGNVQVMPVTLATAVAGLGPLAEAIGGREVTAVVGPIDPGLPNVPFVSVEELLLHHGMARLAALAGADRPFGSGPGEMPDPWATLPAVLADEPSGGIIRAMLSRLREEFTYLNPDKALRAVFGALRAFEGAAGITLDLGNVMGMALHLCCALERQTRGLTGSPPPMAPVDEHLTEAARAALAWLARAYPVPLNDSEAVWIATMAETKGGERYDEDHAGMRGRYVDQPAGRKHEEGRRQTGSGGLH
jgi:transcriptional regulator with AAA-type ATPase domain/transcriptional regulatory protein LevR